MNFDPGLEEKKRKTKHVNDCYSVKDGDQTDVQPEFPLGEVLLSHHCNDE
jgi:hypothetical protein